MTPELENELEESKIVHDLVSLMIFKEIEAWSPDTIKKYENWKPIDKLLTYN